MVLKYKRSNRKRCYFTKEQKVCERIIEDWPPFWRLYVFSASSEWHGPQKQRKLCKSYPRSSSISWVLLFLSSFGYRRHDSPSKTATPQASDVYQAPPTSIHFHTRVFLNESHFFLLQKKHLRWQGYSLVLKVIPQDLLPLQCMKS
jgi:hypothetical protein